MNRLIRLWLLGMGFLVCAHAEDDAKERPNFLFIITDQQSFGAMSCAGNSNVKTPNLDRLAARGVRFSRSYCSYPLCSPSRASLFSSRTPHAIGINGNDKSADLRKKGVPTLGELLQKAGYETAYAGKWHAFTAFPGYAADQMPGFRALQLKGKDPRGGDKKTEQKSPQCDPHIADAAIKFLEGSHAEPFLLTVSLLNPHDICEFGEYEGFEKIIPTDETLLPALLPNHRDHGELPGEVEKEVRKRLKWSETKWRQYLWLYYRLVESSDELIGRVLDALEKSGLSSKTVVVFTSDHGEMMGAHGLVAKTKLYEESVAVPLIIADPKASPRVEKAHLVCGLDLMPTLLDYAGIPLPDSLEGRSLRPLVRGETVSWRDYVTSENTIPAARMIRSTRYKYIAFAQGRVREQLFDMEQDPGELNNLVENAAALGELNKHRDFLKEWAAKTGDSFSMDGIKAGASR